MKNYASKLLFALILACSISAQATEVLKVEVRTEDGIYHMHGESLIQAPAEFIFDIMIDYDNFHLLAGGISETRFLDPEADGTMIGYTLIDSCVMFYCRQFEKVERVWGTSPREIVTEVIPDKSDFEFNRTRWSFKPTENGTLVIYDAQMDPDFWIPPVIGPWAFKKKLWTSAEQLGYRIEYLNSTGKPLSSLSN